VNFTYQFLRRKFVIFSQFLFDDHIKSRLMKDIRFFRDNKEKLNAMYPVDRSAKFNKEIKRLGLVENDHTFLDQFRILITEIGNSMGYVRMIRSGGLNFTSNAIKFVPDLQEIPHFNPLVIKENLSETTAEAARLLDQSIENLVKNFSEGTEYFKLLVNVFAPEFRNPQNVHLQNFYIILPPLTINFIEHIMLTKDKLLKKAPGKDALFTDDGFAIGFAYILKLLDQNKDFDALHWFECVMTKYEEEKAKITAMANQKGQKKDVQQTLTLSLNKVRAYQREFELLYFSFSSARIFFKDS